MATRFYFGGLSGTNSAAPSVSPAYNASWDNSQAGRRILYEKTTLSALGTAASNLNMAVTTGVTSNILSLQFVSPSIPPQRLIGTFSLVTPCAEANINNNSTLAVVVSVCSQDGATIRGVLLSLLGTDTEFPLSTSATRIVNAQAITALTTQPGDRIVVEMGITNTAPTSSASTTVQTGFIQTTDFALTSALTTSLNPWCEFSQNLWSSDTNNYQFIKAGDGMWVSEKLR